MTALLRTEPVRPAPADRLPPLEALLVAGGDARLRLDAATGLNPYGCRPAPRPEAISFASSTASSISEPAYRRAQQLHRALEASGLADFDAFNEAARAELARLYGIGPDGGAIVFAPSGTDAALFALAIIRMLDDGPVASILAAADETGSGLRNACFGRHFGTVTPRGRAVRPGAPVAGLGENAGGISLTLRDAAGRPRSPDDGDSDVHAAVAACVAGGRRVLLYAMHHSKLGARCPSLDCLAEIEARFGPRVQVVVDACQARIGHRRLHWHLERGHIVLLTGSKFFAGPPLSGALLLPPALARRLASVDRVPPGLADYSLAGDWPLAWRGMRAALGGTANLGLLLRWSAALAEIAAFQAVTLPRRTAAFAGFAGAVERAIADFPELSLLPEPPGEANADEEFPTRTIFPFLVHGQGGPLPLQACAKLYRALNRDVNGVLPTTLPDAERRLAALSCHIGQPVALGAAAVLRVSAGAGLAGATAPTEDDLRLVFGKLRLLLRHRAAIEGAF